MSIDFRRLEQFIDSLKDRGIPSADISVWYKRKEIFRHHSSLILMTGEELYFLYSCTKVMTAAATVQLIDRGQILLNDPVSDYIPEFADILVRVKQSDNFFYFKKPCRPVQVIDLLTMSAGFNYDNKNCETIKKYQEETNGRFPTAYLAKALCEQGLFFEPGDHWSYSLCHDILAVLIEKVSGMTFGEYLKKNFFEPIGMKETTFRLTPAVEARMMKQYRFDNAEQRAIEVPLTNSHCLGTEYESGGAGLISSVHDYSLFVDAMCGGGVTQSGERILSHGAIELMRKNALSPEQLRTFNWKQMAGYGYGLGVRTMVNRSASSSNGSVGEFGWGGAAGSYVMIDPDREIGVFYAQHMLNNMEPYVHPRLRNLVYNCLDEQI